MSSPTDNTQNNNDQNIFDQAGNLVKQTKDEAQTKAEQAKGHVEQKAAETQQAAKEEWEKFNKSEQEKKAEGQPTIGDSIGNAINQAKDTTGKVMNDAKEKFDETFSGGDKKNSVDDKKNTSSDKN